MGNVYKRPLTLLERWDQYDFRGINVKNDEIRRALAIAQAVEGIDDHSGAISAMKRGILRRADELLADRQEEGKR